MAAAGLNERLHVTHVITIRDGDAFVSMIAFIVRARDVRTPLFSLISSGSMRFALPTAKLRAAMRSQRDRRRGQKGGIGGRRPRTFSAAVDGGSGRTVQGT